MLCLKFYGYQLHTNTTIHHYHQTNIIQSTYLADHAFVAVSREVGNHRYEGWKKTNLTKFDRQLRNESCNLFQGPVEFCRCWNLQGFPPLAIKDDELDKSEMGF